MSMLDTIIDQMFGGKSGGKPGEPAERFAEVIGGAGRDDGGIGAIAGETVGAAVGALFGGPAGATVGAAAGGQLGGAASKVLSSSVPAGPGTTIDSGGAAQLQSSPVMDSALSVGQSLQRLALRGLQSRPAANGNGKVF